MTPIHAHSNGPDESGWQTLDAHSANVAARASGFASAFGSARLAEPADFVPESARRLIAHVDPQKPGRTESLQGHLEEVRKLAGQFGNRFGCGSLAETVGRCHDFGKAAPDVQDYLWSAAGECGEEGDGSAAETSKRRGPDHSSAGAQFLEKLAPGLGTILAYPSAGHHAGLPDGISDAKSSLEHRLKKFLPDWESPARAGLPNEFFASDLNALAKEAKPFLEAGDGYSIAFLARMLFSCLVDADFLATERFMDGERSAAREGIAGHDFAGLQARLDGHVASLARKAASSGAADSPVNTIREEVRKDCLAAAALPSGLFTLTVPTGGGKTLASMAFALEHARRHGLDRVIYVVPYTSIIEQNAGVFRKVFGNDMVLEHHGNVDWDSGDSRMRLLAENWDAPIVVTTGVQFFESLHGHRPSACRKLHNIARSVVILDEAQSLPVDLLRPCLRALDELVCRYGASVVLCTATQPAVLAGQLAKGGLTVGRSGCREIIPAERDLHDRLRRVVARRISGKITDAELLELIDIHATALVIVNTRRHARCLFEAAEKRFPDRPVFHLSAQMCPQHRADILGAARGLLRFGKPCLLVSTQLIEAGVDIDFPCVFREIAGADSVAQAAGRCNREGRLAGLGNVFLFESAEDFALPGFLNVAAAKGNEVLSLPDFADDLLNPAAVTRYFSLLYDVYRDNQDRLGVLTDLLPATFPEKPRDLLAYKFRTLGESFHLINEPSTSVFVPYGTEGLALCEKLRGTYAVGEQRDIARKLQRYAVSLRNTAPCNREGRPIAELVHDVYWVLTNPDINYDPDFGIVLEDKNAYLSV